MAAVLPRPIARLAPLMDMHVEVVPPSGAGVITLRGEIDVHTAPLLRQRIVDLVDDGVRAIVVDMASVDFVDSTGIGVLTEASKRATAHGATLSLVLTRDPILKILQMSAPGETLPIYRSRDEALQASPPPD